jgi:8-oxo-dGTP pyrophosphatase MutT (NUDIX family)
VFPGGRVDEHDALGADQSWCDGLDHARRQLADLPAAEAIAYHIAAARELFEEAGVLLARNDTGRFVSLAGADEHHRFAAHRRGVHTHQYSLRTVLEREHLRLALDALRHFAHWVTPPVEGRRFDTRFFVARAPEHQTPAHDAAETTDSVWLTAASAIGLATRREIVLPPPTWITLRELEPLSSVNAVLEWASRRRIERREPVLVHENGTRLLVMPDTTRFAWADGTWRPEELVAAERPAERNRQ